MSDTLARRASSRRHAGEGQPPIDRERKGRGYTGHVPEPTRKRTVSVRVGRLGVDDTRMDDDWWESFTPDQRVAMMWDLVRDARAWRGEVGDEPRLQRSVVRIERC